MTVREAPSPIPDSEKGDQRCAEICPWIANTTPQTGNAQQRRQENELQCGFLFRRTGDLG